jgi:hypothetical protein
LPSSSIGFTESRHHYESLIGMTADGTVAFALGDPNALTLPRVVDETVSTPGTGTSRTPNRS